MTVQPFLLRTGKSPRRHAESVIFCAEQAQVIRLLLKQPGLRRVEFGEKIRAAFGDAQIIIGRAEGRQHVCVIPSARAVPLRRDDVELPGVEILEELGVILERDDPRFDPVLIEKTVQDADHRAFQHAYLFSVQGRGVGRGLRVGIML